MYWYWDRLERGLERTRYQNAENGPLLALPPAFLAIARLVPMGRPCGGRACVGAVGSASGKDRMMRGAMMHASEWKGGRSVEFMGENVEGRSSAQTAPDRSTIESKIKTGVIVLDCGVCVCPERPGIDKKKAQQQLKLIHCNGY